MRKQIGLHKTQICSWGLALLLLIGGCTKKSSTSSTQQTNPTSNFTITFNGKTIDIASSSNNSVPVVAITKTDPGGACGCLPYSQVFDVSISVDDPKLSATMVAYKTDLSTAVGVYKVGNYAYIANTDITDYTDGGKGYANVQDTAASSITVTVANSSEVKGTFNVLLTYNGVNYPAIGSFDYKH